MTTTIQDWMRTMVTFTSKILLIRVEFRYVLEDSIQKFASVVCKQLGFSPYGELRIDQGKYYNLTLEPSL